MAKEFAKRFYKSKEWLKCRGSYIQQRISIDGGMCERCKERQGYIVHHKIHITKDNINNVDITLNHNNLEYVCKHCHDREEEHFIKKKEPVTGEGYKFNDRGELEYIPPIKDD